MVPVTVPERFLVQATPFSDSLQANYAQIYMTAHKNFLIKECPECLTVTNMMLNAGHEELKGHGYLIVGACYFNMGCIDESIVYSKCAIEYNPNLAGAYY